MTGQSLANRLFQSTLSYMRSDCPASSCRRSAPVFQSALSYMGSDLQVLVSHGQPRISIHAPLRGERLREVHIATESMTFQSTLHYMGSDIYQLCPVAADSAISIHAPLHKERRLFFQCSKSLLYFNPRSPAWGATYCFQHKIVARTFQSMLPTWGATFFVISSFFTASAFKLSYKSCCDFVRGMPTECFAITSAISFPSIPVWASTF